MSDIGALTLSEPAADGPDSTAVTTAHESGFSHAPEIDSDAVTSKQVGEPEDDFEEPFFD
jgi:hypothetical protein